jgi:uncharacterized protein
MNLLDRHIVDIRKLCSHYKVKELYTFGSVLTNEYNTESDFYLVVDFEPMETAYYADNYSDFKFSLQNILKRPIGLLEEKAIKNPYFKQTLNQQRQLIYGH